MKPYAKAGPNDGRRTSKRMGRPLGSRDKYPRQRSTVVRGGLEERFRQLETAYGAAQRQIRQLEDQLQRGEGRFDGDALELLRKTQRGEYIPSTVQLVAARIIYEQDLDRRRIALDGDRAAVDARGSKADKTIDTFGKFADLLHETMPERVAAGDITAVFATEILSWITEPEPKPLALPAPDAVEPAEVSEDREFGSPQPAPSAEVREDADPPPPQPPELSTAPSGSANGFSRIVYARPFAVFQTASGNRYEADSAGVVEIDVADAADVKDLLRSGCSETRP